MVINHSMDYALLGLLFLAKNREKNVTIGDIAKAERIPAAFLQKIFQKLSKTGIVRAQSGPRGGYRLARNPEEVKLKEVFLAVHAHQEHCERLAESLQKHPSGKHVVSFLETLHADFLEYLNNATLANVLQ